MMLVRIFIPWCKYLLVGMPWCKWPLVGMQWCKWSSTNTNYSKIPFIFEIKAFSMPKTNIFSNLDLLFPKSHLFFCLKLPKEIGDHYYESSDGTLTRKSDDLAQKIYFSQFGWAKGWHVSKAFFWKKWVLWKSSSLKRFIFSSLWIWQFDRHQDLPW